MGREVKRVTLTDAPPMGVTWPGYDCDEIVPCPRCGATVPAGSEVESECTGQDGGVWGCYGEPTRERWDPPAGDGWQMWENTSEGSPISPAFADPRDLAKWLADTGASTFGHMTADAETWLRMIVGHGWATP